MLMPDPQSFNLKYLRTEQHLVLPTVTSIKLTQNLYDVLFQYVISADTENLLKRFIDLMEEHIKSKTRSPFSRPVSDLAFLDEGLQELRLLNWMDMPVAVFELTLNENVDQDNYESEMDNVLSVLEGVMIFSRPAGTNLLWVYPYLSVI
jgi:hypothetical protein